MIKTVCGTALFAVICGPVMAEDTPKTSLFDRLAQQVPAASNMLSGFELPMSNGVKLKLMGYQVMGSVGVNPDKLGPLGCGYHAVMDVIGHVSDTAVVEGAVDLGVSAYDRVAGVTVPLCQISTVLGAGDAEVGAARLRAMNLPVCQG